MAELQDSALLKVFGGAGIGIFPAALAAEKQVCQQYGVEWIGVVEGVKERFYALSVERRLRNPAVVAICESARRDLFA